MTQDIGLVDPVAKFIKGSGLPITTAAESLGPFRGLFYGAPGVGKTRLAASASEVPEMAPVILCDIDAGTMSVSDRPNLYVQHIKSSAQLLKTLRLLKGAENPFKTLILDDLQEFYLMFMRERLQAEAGKSGKDPNVPWQDDWMWCTFTFRRMLKAAKDLPLHLICTTLEQYTADAQTSVLYRTPLMTGKLAWEVEKYFDIAGWLSVTGSARAQKRLLQVQPFQGTRAKDRTPQGRLGSRIEDPTMQVIYSACYEGVKPPQVLITEEEERAEQAADTALKGSSDVDEASVA